MHEEEGLVMRQLMCRDLQDLWAMESLGKPGSVIGETNTGNWSDLEYIRTQISIRLVAVKLGLEVSGNSGRCWRGSQHQNGDRTPSLSFTKRNKAKCHVCDSQAMSVLDLIEG